jgi:dCMP deaminase
MTDLDIDILREAVQHAAFASDDPNTQNAAILASPGYRPVYAANAIPLGIAKATGRLVAPAKYQWIEHAERAAIYEAAATGIPTAGATLYCPWFACTDCARAIIMAGIREVVGLAACRNATPARWLANVEAAGRMLEEAGVGQRWLAGTVGLSLRFDGRELPC